MGDRQVGPTIARARGLNETSIQPHASRQSCVPPQKCLCASGERSLLPVRCSPSTQSVLSRLYPPGVVVVDVHDLQADAGAGVAVMCGAAAWGGGTVLRQLTSNSDNTELWNSRQPQRSTDSPAIAHLQSGAAGVMLQSAMRPSVVTLMGDGSEAM